MLVFFLHFSGRTILYLCRALVVGSKKRGVEEDVENHNRCFICRYSLCSVQ
jgi:hypothetical protein